MELPLQPVKGNANLLRSLLIISHVKCGKTSNCLQIPDSLLIDVAGSSDYFDGTKINIRRESEKTGKGPVTLLKELASLIREKNKEVKGHVYRRLILDELSSLEDIAISYATHLYKKTPQGADYKGNDVTELDYGKGYGLVRDAMEELINPFRDLCETLIYLGHTKTSSMIKGGVSVQINDVNLTGKLKLLIPAHTDANAIMYRDKDGSKNILSFVNKGGDVITGSRIADFQGKEFVISEMKDGKLVTYWDKIFKD